MAKKIRFPLVMADDTEVRDLDELREHFDLEAVLGYYESGKLLTWLRDRYLEDEADAVEELDKSSAEFQQQLCAIFGVDYTAPVDQEAVVRRQERLKKLRTFTDEEEFIDHIDQVAFDQEELADLLDEGVETIYLCGTGFNIPVSKKNKQYIGVNFPTVHISAKIPDAINDLLIRFRNCQVDNLPISYYLDENTVDSSEEVVSYHTDKISGELVDQLFSMHRSIYDQKSIIETPNYIYCASGNQQYRTLINKQTLEIKKLLYKEETAHPFFNYGDDILFTIDDALFFWYKEAIYSFDLANLRIHKMVALNNFGYNKISGNKDYIAFISNERGLCLYDMHQKKMLRILSHIDADRFIFVYVTSTNIYFGYHEDSYYVICNYDLITKKVNPLFKTSDKICDVYHIYEDRLEFYVGCRRDFEHDYYGVIDGQNLDTNRIARINQTFDVMQGHFGGGTIVPFYNRLIYVAKGGIIKSVEYSTGEIVELANDADEHHYLKGGLFSKSSSWDDPVNFIRVGNWIVYRMNGDFNKLCRVSLDAPNEIAFVLIDQDAAEKVWGNTPVIEI